MQINMLFQGHTVFRDDEFDLENFRRFLNYPGDRTLPDTIKGFLETLLLPGIKTTPVAYQYRILPVISRDSRSKQISFAGDLQFTGPMVAKMLANCDLVVVHMLSVNPNNYGDDWQSFLSYCFHNTLIQMSSDALRGQVLADLAISESRLSPRYAPGYCGWPLFDQEVILKILEPAKIGVTYSDAFSLQPAHTITGIYGIRKDEKIRKNMPCYTCTSISCGAHFDFRKELNLAEEDREQFS